MRSSSIGMPYCRKKHTADEVSASIHTGRSLDSSLF